MVIWAPISYMSPSARHRGTPQPSHIISYQIRLIFELICNTGAFANRERALNYNIILEYRERRVRERRVLRSRYSNTILKFKARSRFANTPLIGTVDVQIRLLSHFHPDGDPTSTTPPPVPHQGTPIFRIIRSISLHLVGRTPPFSVKEGLQLGNTVQVRSTYVIHYYLAFYKEAVNSLQTSSSSE